MALIKTGATYVLTHLEGLGQGVGALSTGTEVEVDSVHTDPTPGVGGDLIFVVKESGRRIAILAKDFERLFTAKQKDK